MKFFKFDDFKKMLKDYTTPTYIVKKPKSENGIDGRLVSYVDPDSYIAEQYKALRTNLYSLSPEKPLKTIVITSSQSEEGKTITSCNLAMALSLDKGKKVLLIDADLRKPDIHHIFGLQRKPGLSDILNGSVDLGFFLQKPACGNLYVIPAGTTIQSASEILISATIKSFLEKIKSEFDYIIFDTPPALTVTDASILGALCDGVILLVKADITQKAIVEETFNLLKDAQAKPIATILTNYYLPNYYFHRYKYYYKKYAYTKIAPEQSNKS